jgi:hypothetical protein
MKHYFRVYLHLAYGQTDITRLIGTLSFAILVTDTLKNKTIIKTLDVHDASKGTPQFYGPSLPPATICWLATRVCTF